MIRHDRRRETHRRGAAGVLEAFAGTPDARLRELLAALIRHLHALAAETGLTHREWLAGLEFLTAVGQECYPERQEFILLSDVLGLSAQVDHVNAAAGATEPTVLGPFYRPGAPQRAPGEHIGRPEDGAPALIRGRVTATTGQPIEGATLDVWQCSANGLYDTQDPDQPPFNLRGVFTTGADGRLRVPDGAAGQLPDSRRRAGRRRSAGRGPSPLARSARARDRVGAPGYEPVTTHIFDAANEYLRSDAVFGVRGSLIQHLPGPAGPAEPPDVSFVVDADFVLARGLSA